MVYLGTVMPLLIAGRCDSGKTTVALGLAGTMAHPCRLFRLGEDQEAHRDARLFHRLGLSPRQDPLTALSSELAGAVLVETQDERLPPGWQEAGAKVLGVARYPEVEGLHPLWAAAGEAFAGTVITCVPRRRLEQVRQEVEALGLPLLGLLPEDRALAFPTLGQLREALQAEALLAEGREEELLERVVISSIAKDPGQEYFARLQPKAVIVRSDKPDQQLAALNAGIRCLVVTGDTPILSYVLARAEEEEVALLLTPLSTVEVVSRLEGLIAATPLAGREKAQRAAELVAQTVQVGRLLPLLEGSQPSVWAEGSAREEGSRA